MITSHTNLLRQVQEYVDEYVTYLEAGADAATIEANTDLRRIIAELEALQKHPDEHAADRLAQRIEDQVRHLRSLGTPMPHPSHRQTHSQPHPARPKQTLMQAFRDYVAQEIDYLARTEGSAERTQMSLLLADVVADLRALALHPSDEQATRLAADLHAKRAQIEQLQRPWQVTHDSAH